MPKCSDFEAFFRARAADYARTDTFDDSDWAWEYLRRDPAYRRDYIASRARLSKIVPHVSGTRIHRPRGCQREAAKWGLACFADPSKSAIEAPVFWTKRSSRYQVEASALRSSGRQEAADFDLETDRFVTAIVHASSVQIALVRAAESTLNLAVDGANLVLVPTRLQFRIEGFAALTDRAKALLALSNARKSRTLGRRTSCRTRAQRMRKRSLIALDCRLLGGSLQDTAKVFRALGMTRLTWSASGDEALKKQVWRARNTGLKLMRGGYRKLL